MKQVFVLGAGASHASAGTPLGKDLVWKIPPLSEEEEKRYIKNLLLFVQSIPKLSKYIPQVQRMLETGYLESQEIDKEYYIDELMEDLQTEDSSESIKLIKRLTVMHIVESRNGKGNSLYRKFGEYLAGRLVSEVTVISFNFDCWLREDIKNKTCFDYLIDFKDEDIDSSREFYKSNRGESIPLIKLNGSIDWAFNSRTEKIKLLHRDICPEKDYYSMEKQVEGIEPYIFLPHQQKGELMKPLWDRAEKELRGADKITIIGYSFPAYDRKEVFELFKNIDSKAKWEVVDHEKNPKHKVERKIEIQNKYKEWFPKIQEFAINVNVDGFAEYVRLMEQSSTEKEVPSRIKKHYAKF